MRRTLCAVAALAFAVLLIRAVRVRLAGDFLDPIAHITAQDEALYAHSAIRLAVKRDNLAQEWLTPIFMGRYATYKPPMLMWLSGISARILGVSRVSLRLPIVLICSLIPGLLFLWAAELRGWMAGALAAALLLGNHLWTVTGAMCLTDGLLASFDTAALYFLFYDPWLESRLAFWGFAASVAAAILTKTIAGAIPLAILALFYLLAPRKRRPTLARVCAVTGLALALAAPWFLYELTAHHRWFWTEHVQVELLRFGTGAPPQTTGESNAAFYLKRLALLDPVLLAFAAVALPGFLKQLRSRDADATLLLCWSTLTLAALGWHYRNVTYLVPALPPLVLLAATGAPLPASSFAARRQAATLLSLALAIFAVKAAFPGQPWGLSFHGGWVQKSSPALSTYCALGRGNELIIAQINDDLYASVLPLPRIRYALFSPPIPGGYALDFSGMGITLTATQFNHLPELQPAFRQRLRKWGLDSAEPIGSLILAANSAELAEMIRLHPSSDFFLPSQYRADVEAAAQPAHTIIPAPTDFLFLLSNNRLNRLSPPAWSCQL